MFTSLFWTVRGLDKQHSFIFFGLDQMQKFQQSLACFLLFFLFVVFKKKNNICQVRDSNPRSQ